MKILFIVQGEGRGHLTQAIALEEMLRREGHEVVEMLVGQSKSRHLPGFFNRQIQAPVKRFMSPNFLPSASNKQMDLTRSVVYNVMKCPQYVKSMVYINRRICKSGAHLVINFYELLTGLTYFFFRPSVPQVSVGHQYLFLHRDFEFPHKQRFSLAMLRLFTRLTCLGAKEKLALSFHALPDDEQAQGRVVPPLLRKEVLSCEGTPGDYLHGYMLNAGFNESVRRWHQVNPQVPLHFFWDKRDEETVHRVDDTLMFHQIDDREFLRYMSGCRAYATTAGFESVCEAMYMGKPLLMVPVHIEQCCNAYDAVRVGAGIAAEDFDLGRLLDFSTTYKPNPAFRDWVKSAEWRILRRVHVAAQPHVVPTSFTSTAPTGLASPTMGYCK